MTHRIKTPFTREIIQVNDARKGGSGSWERILNVYLFYLIFAIKFSIQNIQCLFEIFLRDE